MNNQPISESISTSSQDATLVKLGELPRFTVIELPCLLKKRSNQKNSDNNNDSNSELSSDTSFLKHFNMNLKLFCDLLQDKSPSLSFHFPSSNPTKYALASSITSTQGFVAKVVKKRSKRTGETKTFVQIIGHAKRMIKFNNPADYQVCFLSLFPLIFSLVLSLVLS